MLGNGKEKQPRGAQREKEGKMGGDDSENRRREGTGRERQEDLKE